MLQELKTHHRELARLRFEGMTRTEIAARLDTTRESVKTQLNDPLCKAHMAKLNSDADETALAVRKRLARLSVAAIERYEEILDKKSVDVPWPVVQSVAKDTLDRAGHKPPEKHQHSHAHFTIEDLKALRERATVRKPPRQVNVLQERSDTIDSEIFVHSGPKGRHAQETQGSEVSLRSKARQTLKVQGEQQESSGPSSSSGGSHGERPGETSGAPGDN